MTWHWWLESIWQWNGNISAWQLAMSVALFGRFFFLNANSLVYRLLPLVRLMCSHKYFSISKWPLTILSYIFAYFCFPRMWNWIEFIFLWRIFYFFFERIDLNCIDMLVKMGGWNWGFLIIILFFFFKFFKVMKFTTLKIF